MPTADPNAVPPMSQVWPDLTRPPSVKTPMNPPIKRRYPYQFARLDLRSGWIRPPVK